MENNARLDHRHACKSAVTGVGATVAVGSQPCRGKTAALTPKPIKPSVNSVSTDARGALSSARMPP